MTIRRIYDALVHTAITPDVVLLVIAASSLVGYVLTVEAVANVVATWAFQAPKSPALIILMMNLIMLVVGVFLDLLAAILLLGLAFIAIGQGIGLDPIQLGIMMAVSLSIGLFSPPVGTTLFVSAAISKGPVGAIVRELWPYYAVALLVLTLTSYFPQFPLY